MNVKMLAAGIMLVLPIYTANAVALKSCTKIACPSDTSLYKILPSLYECAHGFGVKACYTDGTNNYVHYNCTSCDKPFSVTSRTFTQCGTTTFDVCDCVCNNCVSDAAWSDVGTGYQKQVSRSCDCSSGTATCKETTSYRCAKNWFGNPTSATSGCARCWEDAGAVTKAAGSTSPTDCYIPRGTAFSDSTGSGEYASDCYYTN